MAGQDGQGSVDLFGEDDAREFVRQSNWAEREQHGGPCAGSLRPTVSRADGEDQMLNAGIAEPADVCGEIFRGKRFAAAIEKDDVRGGAGRLLIEPSEQSGLSGDAMGLHGRVAGYALDIVRKHRLGWGRG